MPKLTQKANKKIFKKIDTKLDKILEEIIRLKIDLEVIQTKVEGVEKITDNLDFQINQIKLSQKNQIRILIAIISSVITGILIAALSLLFFVSNP